MKGKNFNSSNKKPRVLISPLDWGLGHATRCIPIVISLIKHGCEVIIAADGATKKLLHKEFPNLVFLPLAGYRVRYSKSRLWLPITLLMQFPKILISIYRERSWLKKTVRTNNIDAVISDNRLGLSHASIPTIYITHQLLIKTGNTFTEAFAQKIHYHFINKFKACWVPDWAGEINIAADLSHPEMLPKLPVHYIGSLSRFEKTDAEIIYDLCFLISGPEPQRTIFEKLIFAAVSQNITRVIIIRGLPDSSNIPASENKLVEIRNHLPASELNKVLLQSKQIIARSGYSTIMDLVKLQRHAILIPTPGQTEQEYLAKYLADRKLFYTVSQEDFNLTEILKIVESFSLSEFPFAKNELDNIVADFVASLAV